MEGLDLVHDVLDMQLLDRRGEKIGRVDALVLTMDEGRAPCVSAILIGGPVRAERIGRWAAWISRALHRLRGHGANNGVSRVPFSAVRTIGETIELDVDGRELACTHLERWLAANVICHIPGARGEEK